MCRDTVERFSPNVSEILEAIIALSVNRWYTTHIFSEGLAVIPHHVASLVVSSMRVMQLHQGFGRCSHTVIKASGAINR